MIRAQGAGSRPVLMLLKDDLVLLNQVDIPCIRERKICSETLDKIFGYEWNAPSSFL